ncbi:MAG TPA: hypothetical protein VIK61_05380 [Acidimicrobiia bacterium]
MPSSRNDRFFGAVCLVVCPMISGAFLGLVAALYVYPAASEHAIMIGALVGVSGFVTNAIAICLTAVAAERHAQRRARDAGARAGARVGVIARTAVAPRVPAARSIGRPFLAPSARDEMAKRSS